jgi:hypothetical protein
MGAEKRRHPAVCPVCHGDGKLWCAMCGTWGDHRSGDCPAGLDSGREVRMDMPLAGDMRSAAAKALDEWLDSQEGMRCGNPNTLRTTEAAFYLRNRLAAAFVAGMEAARRGQLPTRGRR